MEKNDERWNGFRIDCAEDPGDPRIFNVTFNYGIAQVSPPGGTVKKVPSSPKVRVVLNDGRAKFLQYTAGEEDLSITEDEYVARAIEVVENKSGKS